MPTHPDISIREGLVRSHDLLNEMKGDISAAYAALDTDHKSQYLRRCVARAIFSYIESMIEYVKEDLRRTIKDGHYVGELSNKEMEVIGSLASLNGESGRPMPIDDSIKKTFKLAAKVWDLDFKLDTGGNDFTMFKHARISRNRLIHPKTYYDIQVTDGDMHDYMIAGLWTQIEFQRLLFTRADSLDAKIDLLWKRDMAKKNKVSSTEA